MSFAPLHDNSKGRRRSSLLPCCSRDDDVGETWGAKDEIEKGDDEIETTLAIEYMKSRRRLRKLRKSSSNPEIDRNAMQNLSKVVPRPRSDHKERRESAERRRCISEGLKNEELMSRFSSKQNMRNTSAVLPMESIDQCWNYNIPSHLKLELVHEALKKIGMKRPLDVATRGASLGTYGNKGLQQDAHDLSIQLQNEIRIARIQNKEKEQYLINIVDELKYVHDKNNNEMQSLTNNWIEYSDECVIRLTRSIEQCHGDQSNYEKIINDLGEKNRNLSIELEQTKFDAKIMEENLKQMEAKACEEIVDMRTELVMNMGNQVDNLKAKYDHETNIKLQHMTSQHELQLSKLERMNQKSVSTIEAEKARLELQLEKEKDRVGRVHADFERQLDQWQTKCAEHGNTQVKLRAELEKMQDSAITAAEESRRQRTEMQQLKKTGNEEVNQLQWRHKNELDILQERVSSMIITKEHQLDNALCRAAAAEKNVKDLEHVIAEIESSFNKG